MPYPLVFKGAGFDFDFSYVVQFFACFLAAPHVEVVEAALPKGRRIAFWNARTETRTVPVRFVSIFAAKPETPFVAKPARPSRDRRREAQ